MAKSKKTHFPEAKLTVDMVVFGIHEDSLKILLAKRGPEKEQSGKWSLPGGYVSIADGEIPEIAVTRELREKTGINAANCFVEQLYTFASKSRDPRGYTATIAHTVIVPENMTGGIEPHGGDTLEWVHIYDPGNTERWIKNLRWAFDHKKIVAKGHRRLTQKILTDIRFQFTFLPEKFTQAGLRRIFELVKNRSYTRQALGKRFEKMVSDGRVIDTGESIPHGQGRPHKQYRVSDAFLDEMEED